MPMRGDRGERPAVVRAACHRGTSGARSRSWLCWTGGTYLQRSPRLCSGWTGACEKHLAGLHGSPSLGDRRTRTSWGTCGLLLRWVV